MKDVYNEMGEFSFAVFKDATAINHLEKVKMEIDETISEPDDVFEYADCMLALFAAAYKSGFTYEDIENAGREKLEILKGRTWTNHNGIYQHVK